jgi:hypothetical protein
MWGRHLAAISVSQSRIIRGKMPLPQSANIQFLMKSESGDIKLAECLTWELDIPGWILEIEKPVLVLI